jgi:hypothetical protein
MSLTNQGTEMNKTVVAQAIDQVIDQADQAGELFAKSEIDATQALELFARAVGTEPSYDTWLAKRLAFINAYVRIKPTAKGNSADQAFTRFKRRLVEAFGITRTQGASRSRDRQASRPRQGARKVASQA